MRVTNYKKFVNKDTTRKKMESINESPNTYNVNPECKHSTSKSGENNSKKTPTLVMTFPAQNNTKQDSE